MNQNPSSNATHGQTHEEQLQLVTFSIGDEQFAVDILLVQEINRMLDLTQVPRSPEGVEGIINLRGRIIPVMSLRKRFGLDQIAHTDQTRIIVVDIAGQTIGFIVDSVQEVLRIGSSIVERTPPMTSGVDSSYISGVARLEESLLILLDLSGLLPSEEMNQLTELSGRAA